MPNYIVRPEKASNKLRQTGDRAQSGPAVLGSRFTLSRRAAGARFEEFDHEDLAVVRDAGGLLRGALKVLEGAFRLTTAALQQGRDKREISVHFTTVTADIRSADIWGKNFGDREVVVLIEGMTRVTRASEKPVEMREAMTYYQAPKAGAPKVEAIPAQLLNEWAQETEIQPGQGAMSGTGLWKVDMAQFDAQADALALYDSLRRDGYAARILPRAADGGHRYLVRLYGFASQAEAAALGERLKQAYPSLNPAATRR
ncbi:MAG: SPOR domain-containing protein [Burkholderiales bacterium]